MQEKGVSCSDVTLMAQLLVPMTSAIYLYVVRPSCPSIVVHSSDVSMAHSAGII